MTELLSDSNKSYYGVERLLSFYDKAKEDEHRLCSCDGSIALYYWVRRLIRLDYNYYKYAQKYQYKDNDVQEYNIMHSIIKLSLKLLNYVEEYGVYNWKQ